MTSRIHQRMHAPEPQGLRIVPTTYGNIAKELVFLEKLKILHLNEKSDRVLGNIINQLAV